VLQRNATGKTGCHTPCPVSAPAQQQGGLQVTRFGSFCQRQKKKATANGGFFVSQQAN
jgi:hypothetical protein